MNKKNLMPRLWWVLLVVMCACTTLKYSDDRSFLPSAQAESPETPVFLNGKLCKDMDGVMGQCAKRIRSNDTLAVHMDALPYSYTLKLACSKDLGLSKSIPVASGQPWDLVISPDVVGALVFFICRGEVIPDDRPEPVSSFWQFTVGVVDQKYNTREQAYFQTQGDKTYLVLGQHAKYSRVFDARGWRNLSEVTLVEVKGPQANVRAYSESYQARWNQVGY